jgi:glycosyltransferase involved in cell wall biosynthesis
MRILYHHRTHRSHGAEAVHIRGLVTALRQQGHRVDVISPPGGDPFVEHGSEQLHSARNPIWRFISAHCPEVLFELLELSYNILATIKLALVSRPDVIYERYFVFSIAAGLIARIRGCGIVYELNDSSFLKERVRGLALVSLARGIERRVLNRADLIVVISRAMAVTLHELVGIDSKKILVLPNAVDESSIVSAVESTGDDVSHEIVIGCVGFFVPWHGLDLLVDAVADLGSAGLRVRLLLVGDGPVRKEIEQRVSRLGLSDRVTVTGLVPHTEVSVWLSRMDIAVLADSNDYGSPMKIFEYMAAAKAIVAPDYGPVLEVLDHGSTGFVFPRRDTGALRDALAQLVADPALRRRLGENARRSVLREHTWARNTERLEKALRDAGVSVGSSSQ